MRLVGELDRLAYAGAFSDYLTQSGIRNQIMEEPGDDQTMYEIWVYEEDKLEEAEGLFKEFMENPGAEKYHEASRIAKKIKKEEKREVKEQPQYMDARTTIFYRGATPNGALTILLILTCGLISLLSDFGNKTESMKMFFITEIYTEGSKIGWYTGLPEIMRWEVWRLITPIFIHFGPIHLVFNMLWLRDLGNMIEYRKGTLFLAIFIIIVSASSNWAQYVFSHPHFGGMSGVVYGLLGYIWMKGRYEPGAGLALHKSTVMMMIGWYFLCFLLPHIANWVHTVGLVVGVAWGYLTSPHFKKMLKKFKEKNE